MSWFLIIFSVCCAAAAGLFLKIKSAKGPQNRRHERHKIAGEVKLYLDSSSIFDPHAQFLSGKVKDISIGGAKISVPCLLKPGQRIKLSVVLPNKSLNVFAQVIWQSSAQGQAALMDTGVKFLTT